MSAERGAMRPRTHPPGPASPCPGCAATTGITACYTSPPIYECEGCGALWDDPAPGVKVLTRRESYEKRPEWYSYMTPEQLERWFETGEVPA